MKRFAPIPRGLIGRSGWSWGPPLSACLKRCDRRSSHRVIDGRDAQSLRQALQLTVRQVMGPSNVLTVVPVLMLGFLLLTLRSCLRSDRRASRLLAWLLHSPARVSSFFFGLGVVGLLAQVAALWQPLRLSGAAALTLLGFAIWFGVAAGLWFLARRRQSVRNSKPSLEY